MRRTFAVVLLAAAMVGAFSVPAEARVKRWKVKLVDVSHVANGQTVTQVSGRMESANSTCYYTEAVTVTFGEQGTVFGTASGPFEIDDGSFTINGHGPLGEYTISKPKAKHEGDSGKKQICKGFSEQFDFN